MVLRGSLTLHLFLGLVVAAATSHIFTSTGRTNSKSQSQRLPSLSVTRLPLKYPMLFVENVGQFSEEARFQVRDGDTTVWFMEDAIWFSIVKEKGNSGRFSNQEQTARAISPDIEPSLSGVNIKLSYLGANLSPGIEPFNPLETHVSFFLGNDPSRWFADVPVWEGLLYKDLYPGLDLEIAGKNGNLVQRFICREDCGTALEQVKLQIDGAEGIDQFPDLQLLVTSMTKFSPFASSYLEDGNFQAEDSSGLIYSTFLGGGGSAEGIAVDETGAAYVTGITDGGVPTTPGAFDPTFNGVADAFVTKLNPTGSGLVYSTFLGGSGYEYGTGIAIDADGSAYIAGRTSSSDYPITPGAFDPTYSGGINDGFVTKINPDGAGLEYSTYLGGSDNDFRYKIAVDTNELAAVAGYTESNDFPTTTGAFDPTFNGFDDGFVTVVNPTGTGLVFSTFLGTSGIDRIFDLAVDAGGSVYVTGVTSSAEFPTTPGSFDTSFGGTVDSFITKLSSSGADLIYSTFLGGISDEYGYGIAVDGNGQAYVTGITYSPDFPVTPGAFDTSLNGTPDEFVTAFDPIGAGLNFSTFIGGSSYEASLGGIVVDSSGSTVIMGSTVSPDFPTTPDAYDPTYNSDYDLHFSRLSPDDAELVYSTFVGGINEDYAWGVALDSAGYAYGAAATQSFDFPVTPGAFNTTFNAIQMGVILKVDARGTTRLYLPLVGRD